MKYQTVKTIRCLLHSFYFGLAGDSLTPSNIGPNRMSQFKRPIIYEHPTTFGNESFPMCKKRYLKRSNTACHQIKKIFQFSNCNSTWSSSPCM